MKSNQISVQQNKSKSKVRLKIQQIQIDVLYNENKHHFFIEQCLQASSCHHGESSRQREC